MLLCIVICWVEYGSSESRIIIYLLLFGILYMDIVQFFSYVEVTAIEQIYNIGLKGIRKTLLWIILREFLYDFIETGANQVGQKKYFHLPVIM